MSKDWKDSKFVSSDVLWRFIDEMSSTIELCGDDEIGKQSESYKMYLLGQKAAVRKFADQIHSQSESLQIIADDHGVVASVLSDKAPLTALAEVYAEEWYATHGPHGRPIFSLDCREAFLAGYGIAMQLVKMSVAQDTVKPDTASSTQFEPFVKICKLPKEARP